MGWLRVAVVIAITILVLTHLPQIEKFIHDVRAEYHTSQTHPTQTSPA